MRSRLSIFSSRLAGSALIWTVLAVFLIEGLARRSLPRHLASHEVDQMLFDLDHDRLPAGDTVFLGDSVGRQLARAMLHRSPGSLVPLASNASIETIGQYFVLQRYLECHPAPERVILMMFNPVEGNLDGKYTENYFQRGFLRWREIAETARFRCRLPFTLTMIGYKLSPVFRYRIGVQSLLPGLKSPAGWAGSFDADGAGQPPADPPAHSLLDIIATGLKPFHRGPQIADVYFDRLASLLETRGIEWVFLAPPLPDSSGLGRPNGAYGRQIAQVAERQSRYPRLRLYPHFQIYPDDWFVDGSHLKKKHLPDLVKDYTSILHSMGFREPAP